MPHSGVQLESTTRPLRVAYTGRHPFFDAAHANAFRRRELPAMGTMGIIFERGVWRRRF